jgi:hypothetical protein
MLGYPLDARSTSAIAKSISGFAMLRHVDESEVMSRIVIKVCMNAESQVPPSVAERSSGGSTPRRSQSTSSLLWEMKMSSTLLGSCTHYALRRFVGWAPSRDDPIAGESHVAGNITPTHQIQVGQPTPSKILSAPRVIEASPEHQTPPSAVPSGSRL